MQQFAHDSIKPSTENNSKKEQVATMFNDIAPRYDLVNRVLSLGIDLRWRKKAIKKFKTDSPLHLLDMATGTGDLALMAYQILKPQKITGIDLSANMLSAAKIKVNKAGLDRVIELQQGDSETINFDDNTFDAAMVAFGVRNFENLEKGLMEILRVQKPGSQLVVLEFGQPTLWGFGAFYQFYMNQLAPFIAGLFTKNKKAYQYLNLSAKAFPSGKKFMDVMEKIGYQQTTYEPLSFGICYIYSARKPLI